MIYLVFPLGNQHGWGICGWHLSQELARLSPISLLSDPFPLGEVGDELEGLFLQNVWMEKEKFLASVNGSLAHPVLQPVNNFSFLPWEPAIRGAYNAGYIFFEEEFISPKCLENARQQFDVIVAGSSWCEQVLRQNGITNTRTIVQGINQRIFNPLDNLKKIFKDRFVVFSGGKFELRKGQDLVIRAFKVLQDRHQDVLLINSWANRWVGSLKSMANSPHIELRLGDDFLSTLNQTLEANRVDLKRVVSLPPKPHHMMANIYKNTDVGIFPNRCEGGTNLVLMEYLACGKAAIVSNSTGHKDVAKPRNSILLNKMGEFKIKREGREVAKWDEPDLDELVEKLEWAYQNPRGLKTIGQEAGRSMQVFSWGAAARRFHCLLSGATAYKSVASF